MKKKRLLSLLMAAALFVGTAAALPENKLVDNTGIKASAATTTTGSVTRFAGDNRYDTAALISKASYKTSPTVVIADAMTFQDALIAVPLAKAYNAPLLLANPNLVTTQTEKELKRLNAKKVIIVNTNNALKPKTVNALKKYNPTIYKGRTCFETSKIVAEALQAKTKKAPTDVFFTTNKAFADALSISPVAALKGAPILYVDPSKKTLDSNILAYLNKVKGSIKNVYIVGGTVAVPKAIENSIKKALPKKNVKRFDGAQRYETCVMINNYFASLLNSKTVCVAKGLDFPDALAGGVFAANQKAPLLLADSALRDAQKSFLKDKKPNKLYIFGGKVAVPDKLINELIAVNKKTNSAVPADYKNALNSAQSYLKVLAYSRKGLIEQLEFEKFSHSAAVYAADNCGANWNEQAVKSVKGYLKTMPFSKQELIEQLEFEGYTNEQAKYGVSVGYTSSENQNALRKAKSYLNVSAFSKKGLIEQLEFDKYPASAAEYAANNCGANWNEQAVKRAKSYLKTKPFSKQELIEQLEFEGFTYAQAQYGANEACK